jgi:hypothetical protein
MFDLTSRPSFEACAKWKTDLDEKYRMKDGTKCPCLLIGNKCDEITSRKLEQAEVEDFCQHYGLSFFIDTFLWSFRNDFLPFNGFKIINLNNFNKGFYGYIEISVKNDIMVKQTIE